METMKFYTTHQISERYQIHNLTVRRMIADGRLKAVKVGRHWRVSPVALRALERAGLPKMGRPPKPGNRDATGKPPGSQKASSTSQLERPKT
jgi:excisionase family DNA binding protein